MVELQIKVVDELTDGIPRLLHSLLVDHEKKSLSMHQNPKVSR
jgi:hypothetical protein